MFYVFMRRFVNGLTMDCRFSEKREGAELRRRNSITCLVHQFKRKGSG